MERRLWRAMGQLERLTPAFFSMTYGALGSVQQVSIDTAISMHRESPVPVAAHLTCANASRSEVMQVVNQFYDTGIRKIVALRGDAIEGESRSRANTFDSAAELVEVISREYDFDISVAAYPEVHPQASSAVADMKYLKRKLDAGAHRAITQYFFDAECFLRFRDRAIATGINKPIVPGILPVHDIDKLIAFSQRCGATVPSNLVAQFDAVRNCPGSHYQLAVELAVSLCERLKTEGIDQFHFYTLNQTDLCLDISIALGASLNSRYFDSAA